jgi:hypothetical protein
MIEICVDEHQPDGAKTSPHVAETFDFFFKNGYSAWTADGAPRRIEADEVAEVQKTGINTLNTHNFIFADEEDASEIPFLK